MSSRTPTTYDGIKKSLDSFASWLTAQGGEVQEQTNCWEVLRVKGAGKTHVIYTNAKGQLRWPDVLAQAWAAWRRGREFKPFTRIYGRGYRSRAIMERLRKRDGDECFFCGYFVEEQDATIEHLVGRMQGGPNRLANYALAHEDCNQLAGDMSLVKKVQLRDTMRTRLWETAPWLDRPDLSKVMQ